MAASRARLPQDRIVSASSHERIFERPLNQLLACSKTVARPPQSCTASASAIAATVRAASDAELAGQPMACMGGKGVPRGQQRRGGRPGGASLFGTADSPLARPFIP